MTPKNPSSRAPKGRVIGNDTKKNRHREPRRGVAILGQKKSVAKIAAALRASQ